MPGPLFPPERIADIALTTFDQLPPKCKPRKHPDGRQEWTPMSAIVIAFENDDQTPALKCISLATGTKCLSSCLLARCHGAVLHDCHAEVLAIRGFNYWLLSEIEHTLENNDYRSMHVQRCPTRSHQASHVASAELQNIDDAPFRLTPGVSIYLFSTTAPCGDASMELLISSMSPDDAAPWTAERLKSDLSAGQPLGRGHFSLLGAMRRKPARADAEPTLSKSCTDKITLKQFTGLVSFPGDMLVRRTDEAFLTAIVVYPDQFNEVGYARAFGAEGRLKCVREFVRSRARFFNIEVLPDTCRKFEFSRDERGSRKVTNLSALWVAGRSGGADVVEVLVNGVRQGFRQFDLKRGKASVVARQSMVEKFLKIHVLLQEEDGAAREDTTVSLMNSFDGKKYLELKQLPCRREKSEAKLDLMKDLGGWVSNSFEDDFEVVATSS